MPQKKRLTIASFNIHNGADVKHDFRLLAEDIVKSGADIVGLQEVDYMTRRNREQDTLAILSEHTGMPYYCYAPTIDPFRGGKYGIAILSKYPILKYEEKALPYTYEEPAREERRKAIYAQIEVEGQVLHFFNTHSSWDSLEKQLTVVKEWTEGVSPFLVTGDFNCWDFEMMHSVFGPDITFSIHEGNMAELPTVGGGKTIDHILLSKGIVLESIRVMQTGTEEAPHSDHRMPIAEITVSWAE